MRSMADETLVIVDTLALFFLLFLSHIYHIPNKSVRFCKTHLAFLNYGCIYSKNSFLRFARWYCSVSIAAGY